MNVERRRLLIAWTSLFAGSLALAAALSPAIFRGLIWALGRAPWPYSRVFDRVAMVIALSVLIAFRRDVGWRFLPRRLGDRGPKTAAIEESFFRGLILGSLTEGFGFRAAAIVSSLLYAAVHLLVSDVRLGQNVDSPWAGFIYLEQAVARQIEVEALAPLVALFVCGMVLTLVVRQSASLYPAIGMHAAWVFAFQTLRHASRPVAGVPGHSFLGTHHFLVGTWWAGSAILLSGPLWLCGAAYFPERSSSSSMRSSSSRELAKSNLRAK
ncbi:MAG: CPBP family intramembrane glutamic endopeptidase [Thermoanaerobaculia bacterium]